MGVLDDRWTALQYRYGVVGDPMARTTNDLLASWRAEFGLTNGDSVRDHIMALYPSHDSYVDAEAEYWADRAEWGVLWGAVLWLDASTGSATSTKVYG
jgi:hypothetical protein